MTRSLRRGGDDPEGPVPSPAPPPQPGQAQGGQAAEDQAGLEGPVLVGEDDPVVAGGHPHPFANEQGQWIAQVHAWFGEKDSAFVWLNRHVWTMAELTDPRAWRGFDSLRSDPRYAEHLRRVGLQ